MSHDVSERVLTVLEAADEPLTAGRIQRRIATDGLDVASSAIRAACRDLAEEGRVETVEESATKYRLADV